MAQEGERASLTKHCFSASGELVIFLSPRPFIQLIFHEDALSTKRQHVGVSRSGISLSHYCPSMRMVIVQPIDLGFSVVNVTISLYSKDGSGAIVLHNHFVDGARALGDTGLYVGGLAAAVELTDNRGAKAEDFKFFFSHLAWPDGGLEQQVILVYP